MRLDSCVKCEQSRKILTNVVFRLRFERLIPILTRVHVLSARPVLKTETQTLLPSGRAYSRESHNEDSPHTCLPGIWENITGP